MSGAGTLTTQGKSVTAAGTFTCKSSSGNVVEAGVWIASELVSFDLYGIVPGVLMREGRALGPPQFGHAPFASGGRGMFSGSMPAGGLAVLRIRLLPVLGVARNATLQVNCALGKVPPAHSVEGIRLTIEGGDAEFDEEISGRALFLLNRIAASSTAKEPAPEPETNPATKATEGHVFIAAHEGHQLRGGGKAIAEDRFDDLQVTVGDPSRGGLVGPYELRKAWCLDCHWLFVTPIS